jgi:pSer/pThr/pTyr-binding forkhead associated (FHA) protein
MQLTLVYDNPQASRQEIVLDRLPAMIGRSDDVDVQLEDCSVSHYHCKIDNLGGVVVVRDLGSRLGTYVNGDDVTESVLRSGDLLTLGTASFRALYEPRPKARCRSPLTQRAKFHG